MTDEQIHQHFASNSMSWREERPTGAWRRLQGEPIQQLWVISTRYRNGSAVETFEWRDVPDAGEGE